VASLSRLARFGTKEGRFRQKRHPSLLQIETFSPVHDLDGKSPYEGVSPALGKERIGRARISARSGHGRAGRGGNARRHDAAEESAISLSPLPRVTTPSGPAYPSNRVSSLTFRVPLGHRQLKRRLHLAQVLMSGPFESQADRLHNAFLPWRFQPGIGRLMLKRRVEVDRRLAAPGKRWADIRRQAKKVRPSSEGSPLARSPLTGFHAWQAATGR